VEAYAETAQSERSNRARANGTFSAQVAAFFTHLPSLSQQAVSRHDQRQEPDAVNLLVRIRAGGGQ
jgi:hypothetical protein